jgi:hypothetical protein
MELSAFRLSLIFGRKRWKAVESGRKIRFQARTKPEQSREEAVKKP